jgi:hypothetical protein
VLVGLSSCPIFAAGSTLKATSGFARDKEISLDAATELTPLDPVETKSVDGCDIQQCVFKD